MVSTFKTPVINSVVRLDTQTLRETGPIQRWPNDSSEAIDIVIRAIYKQVLGNAHIMESERLTTLESQLKQGNISVREFVRQVAKSELYRSRFVENCYRYRAIELNFKHLLGRAPQTFEEMKVHSHILDTEGYEADIDSYVDSDEYQNAFGENIVPYYRGYGTVAGQTMLEFANMLKLRTSISGSDKDSVNAPRLTKAIIQSASRATSRPRDTQDILAYVLRPNPATAPTAQTFSPQQQTDSQDELIAKLRQQIADLQSLANIGNSIVRKGQRPSATSIDNGFQHQTADKAAVIERLRGELMEARALATIGEARLNKWRR
ncbi:MAG: phycobilisome rod-core linker polypeptide [Cyanobacteria bacterium P01_H01_bin.21]